MTEAQEDLWYRRYTRPTKITFEVTWVGMWLILGVIGASQGEWLATALCFLIGVIFLVLVRWRWRQAWAKERPR